MDLRSWYLLFLGFVVVKKYGVGNKMHKAFPLPGIEFPLAEEVPTASEEGCHCQKKREATVRKIALLSKSRRNYQSKSNDSFTKFLNLSYFEITQYDNNIRRSLINSFQQVVSELDTTSGETGKKSRRTVTLTAEDMQKRKNDVKARTTLLLSLLDEHQLRFSKYKTTQELWAAILKTFGGNEATKKTKKNLLKQQYGNFKAKSSETLEQKFNRLQVIVGQLQFMDVEIKQDDLNQKFLTSLAQEWRMHTIVWRNRSNLDTMSLDDLYNHLKVYESEVQKKLEPNSQNMAFISSAKHNSGNKVKISIQGSDVAGFDKSKVECFNCHKMGHFARECRAPRSQDRGRRDNCRQGSKVEEQAPKALMVIDGVGWDWSYMVNDGEDHALVADEEAPAEFALMANTSTESKKLEILKKEKEWVDWKLAGFLTALKDLDNLIENLSWTSLLEFADDTITDYSRPSPTMKSTSSDDQNRNPSVSKTEASPSAITPKPFIKFVKASESPTESKIDKAEKAKKSPVKYAEQYRKTNKKPNVRGNQRNWNNLKSHQLGPDFVLCHEEESML
nr:hypothetical protein [Tanacetum cinerariifolium]